MTSAERAVVTGAIVVTVIWVLGLLAFHFLIQGGSRPATVNAVQLSAGGSSSVVAAASSAGPQIAAADLNTSSLGLPTIDEKRKHLKSFWNGQDSQPVAVNNANHGRWEDRTGIQLPPIPGVAGDDAILSPTLVSIHLKEVPLRDALTELGKVAGAKLVVFPPYVWRQNAFPPITLDADNQPLVEVINELCCKAGLATGWRSMNWGSPPISADPTKPILGLQPQFTSFAMGPWVDTGPFAFEVEQVNHQIGLTANPTQTGMVTVSLVLQHEPRLVVLGVLQQIAVTQATDDGGRSLIMKMPDQQQRPVHHGRSFLGLLMGASSPTNSYTPSPWQAAGQPLHLSLSYPADAGKWIEHLKIAPKFLVQTAAENLEIPIDGNQTNGEHQAGGLTVKIQSLMVQNANYSQGSIQFTRGKQTDDQWQQMQAALASLKPVLVDDNGSALPAPQVWGQNSNEQSVSIQCMWQQPQYTGREAMLKPTKLIISVPTAMREVDVPIQFDHLPLP